MAKSKSKLMKCANIFAKLAAPTATRSQLTNLYSAAKRVGADANITNDKNLISKSKALFQIASRLLWNADNHGVTASFFASMLGRMSSLSSDMSAYVNKQVAGNNPFIKPVFGQGSNSINNFDVALSRTIPIDVSALKPQAKPQPKARPSLELPRTELDWPKHPSENEGLGPDGEILYTSRGRQDPEATYPSPYGPNAPRIPRGQPVSPKKDVRRESVVRKPAPPVQLPGYEEFAQKLEEERVRNKRELEGQPQPGENLLGGNLTPTIPGPDGRRIPMPR